MGEAKRRKQLDPTYGKPNERLAKVWFDQMLNNLPPNHKPDGGHQLYRIGFVAATFFLSGRIMLLPDKMGMQISYFTKTHCFSILLDKQNTLLLFPALSFPINQPILYDTEDHSCELEIELKPNLRYQSPSGEFIIPMIGKVKQQSRIN